MALSSRIESLQSKHNELKVAIQEERKRSVPDEVEIQKLKRNKLKVKDEIRKLLDAV
jgi:hypothetical protein